MRPSPLTAVAGVLLFSLAPTAQAVEFPFGTIVGSSDYDLSPLPSVSGADLRYALCVIDLNGNGAAEAEDYILLVTKVATAGECPASVQANTQSAILLNTIGGTLVAGSEMKISHDVAGSALIPMGAPGGQFPHALRYYEDGTDASKLDAKDTLYLDLRDVAAGFPSVGVGDLRITAVTTSKGTFPGGTLVKPGDADESRELANIRPATAPATKLVSTANMVYKAGSGYYVNSDAGVLMGVSGAAVTGDVGVESGDVRLNPKAVNPLSDRPAVTVQGLSLSSLVVRPGETFQLSVVVKNDGKAPGSGLVKTAFDGVVVDARGSPTVYPTESATLIVSLVAPPEAGRYAVKAGDSTIFVDVEGEPVAGGIASLSSADLEARIVQLESRLEQQGQDGSEASANQAKAGIPGLAPSLVVLILLAAVALARRQA